MRSIDVLQLEYTVLGQYAGEFRRIPSILFEHDVYFQSIARRLAVSSADVDRKDSGPLGISAGAALGTAHAAAIWIAFKFAAATTRSICCRFLPELEGRIDDGYRAGIDTSRYPYQPGAREPFTMLFLGSFRHTPNQEALTWFVEEVFPLSSGGGAAGACDGGGLRAADAAVLSGTPKRWSW